MPARQIACATLVVRDYDEAIDWYTRVLGFELREDRALGDGKRWVTVAPSPHSSSLLLARAADDAQRAAVGQSTGGRVAFFLHTDDFAREHAAMQARGVRFIESPRTEAYGTVAVFEDLYGTRWDLLEPRA